MRAAPLTIAFFASTRKWGGVKTWSLDMGLALQRRGHRVWIVAPDGPFVERAVRVGLRVRKVRFGADGNPVSIGRFLRFFRTENVDYVVVNLSKEMRTAGVAARLLGIPLVHRIGAPEDLRDRLKTRLTQRFLAPRLLTCSDYVRRELLEKIPLFRDYEFVAIHPGVLPIGAAPGSVGSPRRIVLTSQLRPEKGHGHLLEALSEIRRGGHPCRCVIAGTGPCEEALRRQADALGVADAIEWTGFVQDVTSLLQRADIFVLPSLSEPLGIALEEAMAHGLVPVARRAGGVPEIWPAGLEPFLFPPQENAAGFARVLKTILEAPDDRVLEWKRLAWEHAVRAFHIEKQCNELVAWLTREPPGA
ncbi:MAG: glycosyltransferase [bacterium]